MKKYFLFLILLIFNQSIVHAELVKMHLQPWQVLVQSKYSKTDLRQGIGQIIVYENRYFVLTASHVSQGDQGLLVIDSQGQSLEVLGRLSNNFYDAEIIEFKPTSSTVALASGKKEEQNLVLLPSEVERLFLPQIQNDVDIEALQQKGVLNIASFSYLLTPLSMSAPKINTSQSFLAEKNIWLGYLPYRNEWIADVRIYPGISGSVLVSKLNGQFIIQGLASQYMGNKTVSLFADIATFVGLLSNYIQRVSLPDPVSLVLIHGETRRLFEDGTSDECPQSQSANINLDSGCNGGGCGSDGGSTVLQSHQSKRTQKKPQSCVGIFWKNRPTLGFQVERSNEFIGTLLGDLRAIRFNEVHSDIYKLRPVFVGESLISLLEQRLALAQKPQENIDELQFSATSYKQKIDIVKSAGSKNYIRVAFTTGYGETLEFTLDQYGRLINNNLRISDPFVPIIKVGKYSMDITGLFFGDLMNIKYATSNVSIRSENHRLRVDQALKLIQLEVWPSENPDQRIRIRFNKSANTY